MLFSYTFHKDISPHCYSKFRGPVCHVPSKNSAAVPHLAIFSDTLSVTLSTRTVVSTAIRTFVLHPVALLASFPSSKNSAAAPHLRFFRLLFTLPSMVQSSQQGPTSQFNVCARGLTWKGCIDNVEKPNACHRLGSVRCSCHVTSTESL